MNKILLISISLLIFLAAIASAAAADLNSTASDDCTCTVDSDVVAVEVNNSTCQDEDAPVMIQDNNTHRQSNDTDCHNGKSGDNNDIRNDIKGIATKKDLRNRSGDMNLFSPENPNHIVVTQEKIDSLKCMISSCSDMFKRCYSHPLKADNPNGALYSPYELIITAYAFNSYENTIIIVTQVLNHFGYNTTEALVEQTMNEMRCGACDIDEHNQDVSYYMHAIQQLDQCHHNANA